VPPAPAGAATPPQGAAAPRGTPPGPRAEALPAWTITGAAAPAAAPLRPQTKSMLPSELSDDGGVSDDDIIYSILVSAGVG